jgi:hypothetical protein
MVEATPTRCFFPQAVTVIVLATICLLACVFFLFVLFQWTRDTKRKTTTRTAVDDAAGETGEKKRPQIVGPKRTNEKHDRFLERSRRASSTRGGHTAAGLAATTANVWRTRGS